MFFCFALFQGGIYLQTLLDWYPAGYSPMIMGLSEILVISYVYGKFLLVHITVVHLITTHVYFVNTICQECYNFWLLQTNAVMKAKIDTYLTFNGKHSLVVGKNCERIETKKMWQMCMQCKHLH